MDKKKLQVIFLKCNSSFFPLCAHNVDEFQGMSKFARHTKYFIKYIMYVYNIYNSYYILKY
jgi:hypothetical protein